MALDNPHTPETHPGVESWLQPIPPTNPQPEVTGFSMATPTVEQPPVPPMPPTSAPEYTPSYPSPQPPEKRSLKKVALGAFAAASVLIGGAVGFAVSKKGEEQQTPTSTSPATLNTSPTNEKTAADNNTTTSAANPNQQLVTPLDQPHSRTDVTRYGHPITPYLSQQAGEELTNNPLPSSGETSALQKQGMKDMETIKENVENGSFVDVEFGECVVYGLSFKGSSGKTYTSAEIIVNPYYYWNIDKNKQEFTTYYGVRGDGTSTFVTRTVPRDRPEVIASSGPNNFYHVITPASSGVSDTARKYPKGFSQSQLNTLNKDWNGAGIPSQTAANQRAFLFQAGIVVPVFLGENQPLPSQEQLKQICTDLVQRSKTA